MTTICVAVAEMTGALTPLMVTVGLEQKSVPYMISALPGRPLPQLAVIAAGVPAGYLPIPSRLPAAS